MLLLLLLLLLLLVLLFNLIFFLGFMYLHLKKKKEEKKKDVYLCNPNHPPSFLINCQIKFHRYANIYNFQSKTKLVAFIFLYLGNVSPSTIRHFRLKDKIHIILQCWTMKHKILKHT